MLDSCRRSIVIMSFMALFAVFGRAQSNLILTGASPYEDFGWAHAVMNDIDGDGVKELVVTAQGANSLGTNTGRVDVLSGQTFSTIYGVTGAAAFDFFGETLAVVDDLDGDGFDDLLVGAQDESSVAYHAGKVTVVSGASGTILYSLHGSSTNELFGASLAGIDDIDGDGHGDFAVGAPFNSYYLYGPGDVHVFSGFDGSPIYSKTGNSYDDLYGCALCRLGDVDADGVDDFVIGAWRNDVNGFAAGRVVVVSGASGQNIYALRGAVSQAKFGYCLAAGGDINGDGMPDFIVGSPGDPIYGAASGAAHAISGVDGTILYSRYGSAAGDDFGISVSGGGDLNGDGYADFAVGAPRADPQGNESGKVFVFSGKDGSTLRSTGGGAASAHLGQSVGLCADLSGDGFADLTACGNGSLRVYFAPTLPALFRRSEVGTTGLRLQWQPDGGDETALTGSVLCSGATPGGNGLVIASLAGIDELAFGFLPILIDLNPVNIGAYGYFGFGATGELTLPNLNRQLPVLAGLRMHVQVFEWSPFLISSNALRFELVP